MVFSFSGRKARRRSQADYAELLKLRAKQGALEPLNPA